MKLKTFWRYLAPVVLCASIQSALAQQVEITINGVGNNRIPVGISAMAGEQAVPRGLSDIVRADLDRSGLFKMIEMGPTPLADTAAPEFDYIRGKGADFVLSGGVYPGADGRFDVRVRLYDVTKQGEIGALALRMAANQSRATAHRIADFIYEKLTGVPGFFATRIAYVVKNGSRYELQISDADGQNPQTALASREPIISPTWSPDGNRIAYVSFEAKKPIVYVHTLSTGARHVVANFKGSNSAPAWSPDGRKLAVVLTKDGLSQVYTVNADGSGVQRISNSSGIDTEPNFSSDGQMIYFTSDRGGSPQIYRSPASGGSAERVTLEGGYNVSPRLSSDGKSMAFVTRNGAGYQIASMDLASRQVTILSSNSSKDESPSFAPNGKMVLYASESRGRGVLSAVSPDGQSRFQLSIPAATVREPAWGPLPR